MVFGRSQLLNRSPILRYGTAVLFVGAALLLATGLWQIVDRPVSTPLFLAAIVLATWSGGLRMGMFAAVLTTLVFDYFFIQPSRATSDTYDLVMRMAVFFVQGGLLAWLTERLRMATDELSNSREELRRLTQHQQSLREAEQKRIAREIHDELGQALTGLKLDLHLMGKEVVAAGDEVPCKKVLDEIEGFSKRIDTTIGTVRRISSEIRPSILDDFGLVAAIEWQAREFERKTGVECLFRSNSENLELDTDSGNAVFRIFQEALTNIARHAEASKVKVMIDGFSDRIAMRVEDNGRGIEPRSLNGAKSLGILGMRERARLIGADISIDRLDDGGTSVELILPARRRAAEVA
jgi:signal transduction histidine kinase